MNYTTKIKDANGVEKDFKPFSYDITVKEGHHDGFIPKGYKRRISVKVKQRNNRGVLVMEMATQ